MPEEEVKENVENQEEAIEVSSDKTKSIVVSLIVLSVLVMVLTPVITIFAVKAIMPSEASSNEPDVSGKIKEITLDDFRVNIAQTQGTRYAQVKVVLEVNNGDMERYFKLKSPENPDGMLNRIKSEITNIISDKSLSGLLTKDAKNSLANEIKAELNKMLEKKKAKGIVKEVYFPSFLVQ
jgi:flagellar basal body-associated protein FliL